MSPHHNRFHNEAEMVDCGRQNSIILYPWFRANLSQLCARDGTVRRLVLNRNNVGDGAHVKGASASTKEALASETTSMHSALIITGIILADPLGIVAGRTRSQ